MNRKKLLFGVFAHPDDEAFGPSATILKQVADGTELHLVLGTNGEAGMNLQRHDDLGQVRLKEWRDSAKALGATSLHALGYPDGKISQSMLPEMSTKVESIIAEVCEESDTPVELSLMTFEPQGITGHLDHIGLSRVTSSLFEKFKQQPPKNTVISSLWYYCLSLEQAAAIKSSGLYAIKGRDNTFINEKVGVRDYLPKKIEIMDIHKTQRSDAQTFLAMGEDLLATDYFHVVRLDSDS